MSIEFKNITKTYDQAPVLENINAEIENGEFFAVVGPSGCGKSTLLRMLAGLIDITDGIIKINGKQINGLAAKDRNLTMVFQDYALFPFLNVEDNIAFGLKARKMPEEEIKRELLTRLKWLIFPIIRKENRGIFPVAKGKELHWPGQSPAMPKYV